MADFDALRYRYALDSWAPCRGCLFGSQIHDEVILEGPEESAEEAMEEVVRCMQEPWDGIGLKELRVS